MDLFIGELTSYNAYCKAGYRSRRTDFLVGRNFDISISLLWIWIYQSAYAFRDNQLKSVEFPAETYLIDYNAFADNLLQTISINAEMKIINRHALANNCLKSVRVPRSAYDNCYAFDEGVEVTYFEK